MWASLRPASLAPGGVGCVREDERGAFAQASAPWACPNSTRRTRRTGGARTRSAGRPPRGSSPLTQRGVPPCPYGRSDSSPPPAGSPAHLSLRNPSSPTRAGRRPARDTPPATPPIFCMPRPTLFLYSSECLEGRFSELGPDVKALRETIPRSAQRKRHERRRQGAAAVHEQVTNGVGHGVLADEEPLEDLPVGADGDPQGKHRGPQRNG